MAAHTLGLVYQLAIPFAAYFFFLRPKINQTPNEATALDAGNTLCFHIGHQWAVPVIFFVSSSRVTVLLRGRKLLSAARLSWI